jgi:hypothetical protein
MDLLSCCTREEAALRQLERHTVGIVTRVCSSPQPSRAQRRQMAGQQERAPQTYSNYHLLTALTLPLHILAVPHPLHRPARRHTSAVFVERPAVSSCLVASTAIIPVCWSNSSRPSSILVHSLLTSPLLPTFSCLPDPSFDLDLIASAGPREP